MSNKDNGMSECGFKCEQPQEFEINTPYELESRHVLSNLIEEFMVRKFEGETLTWADYEKEKNMNIHDLIK